MIIIVLVAILVCVLINRPKTVPDQTPENPPKAIQNIDSRTTTIEVVPKTGKQDNDIELKTAPGKLKIAVNDKPPVELDLKPETTTNIDGGKLIISQSSKNEIKIDSPEYERSKWLIGVGMDGDKNVRCSVGYEIGRSTMLQIQVGENQKPFYGLLFRIGDSNKK